MNGRNYYWYNFQNTDQVAMVNSLLERKLVKSWTMSGFSSTPNSALFPLSPGSYVALVPHVAEVELGTDAAREEASFHVIVGEW